MNLNEKCARLGEMNKALSEEVELAHAETERFRKRAEEAEARLLELKGRPIAGRVAGSPIIAHDERVIRSQTTKPTVLNHNPSADRFDRPFAAKPLPTKEEAITKETEHLTAQDGQVLRCIQNNPRITQKGISKMLDIPQGTVSYHCRRLEHRNLIESKAKGRRKFYRQKETAL